MKESYRCSCCTGWYSKKELDHISYSTEYGKPMQYIFCKKCKKAGCLGSCKYLLNDASHDNSVTDIKADSDTEEVKR